MTEAWWKTDRTDTHCLRMNIEHGKITDGQPRRVLLLSDIHWDSSHCLRSQLKKVLDEKGGFVSAHWDGTAETETKIKEETKATIRCIPLDGEKEDGKCVFSGKLSSQRVLFARAY